MNKSTFELLRQILGNNGKPVSFNGLSEHFGVGARTFYNYWDEISDYLSVIHAQPLVLFNGHEFWFSGSPEDLQFLYASMSSLAFYEYRLSSAERTAIIIALLAENEKPIKNSTFEKIFYVSRNTVIADMRQVRKCLEDFKIEMDENKHFGSRIKCGERTRRRLITYAADQIDAVSEFFMEQPCNPCVAYLISYLRIGKFRRLAEDAVRSGEDRMAVKLTDQDFYQLIFLLIVGMGRVRSGHLIKREVDLPESADQFIMFAEFIFNHLGEDIPFNRYECGFFIECAHRYRIISHLSDNRDAPEYISLLIHDLLKAMNQYYDSDLLGDALLNEYLTAHILACYHRVLKGEVLNNPYLSKIKQAYPQDYQNLMSNIYLLENGLNLSLNEGEAAYILMHILASVERNRISQKVPDVLLVCPTGRATSSLLSALIRKNFKVNIIDTVSVHDVTAVTECRRTDLIISTVPVAEEKIPSVIVNAVLTDADLAAVHNALMALHEEPVKIEIDKGMGPGVSADDKLALTDLIPEEFVLLDKPAADWQEAVIAAGEVLLWKNCITANYLHQMIDLVIKYGPYIVIAPGVAIAHASPTDGVIRPAVSIVRLKEPVAFGKPGFDPVSAVVACAIEDSVSFSNTLLQLMNIIRRPDFLPMIKKAACAADVLSYFDARGSGKRKP